MPQTTDRVVKAGIRLFVAFAAGLWLWVFLRPMQQLGLLTDPQSFAFVFVALILAQCVPSRWVRVLVALVASTFYMWRYFHPQPTPALGGLVDVLHREWVQLHLLVYGGPFTDPLQTQVFLFSLCGIYWLLVYAAQRSTLWLFYNGLGVLVLGVVDAYTNVHPNAALVAVLVICCVTLGITHFDRLRPAVEGRRRPVLGFFLPTLLVVGVASLVAAVLPKQPAVWADPLKQMGVGTGGGSGGQAAQLVIGYQPNDAHLGGSFAMNSTPVLEVVTPYAAYLQGQVLDRYTGKGWVATAPQTHGAEVGDNLLSARNTFGASIPTKSVRQTVTVLHGGLHASAIFGAYAIERLNRLDGAAAGSFQVNPVTTSVSSAPLKPGEQYQLTSRELEDPSNVLTAQPPLPSNLQSAYPASVQQDLQLPGSLPSRDRKLAQTITAGNHTELGKVQSVISYLQSSETYATQGILRPGRGQDYVDQFLFETHQGYCNNFSSAAAVLLRAVNLPTRWVTGFTDGEMDPSYSGTGNRYIITNEDAHSWIQVYFPNVGWIPFDPTPSFQLPFVPGADGSSSPTPPPVQPPTQPKTPAQPSTPSGQTSAGSVSRLLEVGASGLGGLLALAVILAIVFRRRVQVYRYQSSWKGDSTEGVAPGMRGLLKLLRARGMVGQRPGMTLRDLQSAAQKLDISDEDYRHLVKTAETVWYGQTPPPKTDVRRTKRTWLRWMQRAIRRHR